MAEKASQGDSFSGLSEAFRQALGNPSDGVGDPGPVPPLPARYRCLGRVRRGGVGRVLAYRDLQTDRIVAIKVLAHGLASQQQAGMLSSSTPSSSSSDSLLWFQDPVSPSSPTTASLPPHP